jgi:hypothetical protein
VGSFVPLNFSLFPQVTGLNLGFGQDGLGLLVSLIQPLLVPDFSRRFSVSLGLLDALPGRLPGGSYLSFGFRLCGFKTASQFCLLGADRFQW